MSYTYQWRKAMAVSVCLHFLVFAAAGFLNIGLTAPVPVEEVVLEMDLVSDPSVDRTSGPAIPEPAPPQAPQPTPIEPAPTEPQPPSVQPEPAPVVTANEFAVTDVEAAPASAPVVASPSSSQSAAPSSPPSGGGGSPGGIAAPGVLSKVEPSYPSAARKAGQQGVAVLRVKVLANGRPGDVAVLSSSGHEVLDDAAVTAVKKWRFVPAKDRSSGQNLAVNIKLPISFKLY